MVDLAIVVVNYNVSELLRRCLQSIYGSQGDISFALCVVDNDSGDGSVAMVRSEFPRAMVIANSENVGYAVANNQGMKALGVLARPPHERPRYVLLLNPDTELPADTLGKAISYMDQHPRVGVTGPKLIMPNGQLDLACRRSFPSPSVAFYRMVGLSRLFPRSRRFGRYNMTYLDENETNEVDSVVGAFMLVRREAVARVGLMDERFFMYGEDLDWAKRIKDAGWQVIYYPGITVLHVKRASSRQNQQARREFYRAMLIFYYKHYHSQTSVALHWLILLGIALQGGRSVMPHIAAGSAILQTDRS